MVIKRARKEPHAKMAKGAKDAKKVTVHVNRNENQGDIAALAVLLLDSLHLFFAG